MRVGIIGGGMLGLSIGHFLQRAGHTVHIFERNAYLGGLAGSYDYGEFTWDRFYHVVLPQDQHLIELFCELGLEPHFRWKSTRTGYFGGGRFYSMSSTREMLTFPLLGWGDKLRMGIGTLRAVRFANRDELYRLTAGQWLTKVFGRSNYEVFWRPLLRAKFGDYAERVAALSIQSTLARLFGARSAVARREAMGYVHGGYHRVLAAFRDHLERDGAIVSLNARIDRIGEGADLAAAVVGVGAAMQVESGSARTRTGGPARMAVEDAPRAGCAIEAAIGASAPRTHWFDKVILTAPVAAALPALSDRLRREVSTAMAGDAVPSTYLGVVSLNLVLRRPLTGFYVLNVADGSIPLTGVIEMTALIDQAEETAGRTLVYLPRYLASDDPLLAADDAVIREELFERGLRRLLPELSDADVVSFHVQRARHVQPLRFVTDTVPPPGNRPPMTFGSFVVANTSLLACPTLNNNEVVGLAKQVAAAVAGPNFQ